jgi:hypothetical protein
MAAPGGQRPQFGRKGIEIDIRLATQCLAEDVPHFGLCGMPMPRGAPLQSRDQIIVEIAYAHTGHCPLAYSICSQ